MKITILGNSVALRVRPPENQPENKNYTYWLREKLDPSTTIENISLGATTITNWLKMSDQVINCFPNIYIIHVGVVDSTIREVPLWFYRLSNRKVDNILTKFFKLIYRGVFSKIRAPLSKLRGSRSWVSLKRFEKSYDHLFSMILKDTNAKIIAMPINLANNRVEKQLPGTIKSQKKFNEAIQKVVNKHSQTIVDLDDLRSDQHYPDGVHFNKSGHEIVANKLVSIINEI
ncbi:GDSL-like Lipase/Acylhydrolase family protein [Ekhidna lutea]|uniref:GDSL-like Lipase/Acylhydrolase family protein n=1 Tax=Ekhidna lutea TaxID=447679 RepID=A0A239M201_EKHLU|nr:SGNH/GDSL hydrolase family protein [Ekhidna lutea]SNT36103.1 GDSL-like Lipase/Acylhydrolase family protein [Ekhidna lutea]